MLSSTQMLINIFLGNIKPCLDSNTGVCSRLQVSMRAKGSLNVCCDTGDWTCPTYPPDPPPPDPLHWVLCSVMFEYLNCTEAALAVGFPEDFVHSRHSERSMANRKVRISNATLLLPAWPQWVGYNNAPSPSRKFFLLSRDLRWH